MSEVMKNNSAHNGKCSTVKWKDVTENVKNSHHKTSDKRINENKKNPRKNEQRRPSVMISLLIKTSVLLLLFRLIIIFLFYSRL